MIMGPEYSQAGGISDPTNTLLEVHERLARNREMGDSADNLDASFRLLVLLNDIDVKLLYSLVKQLGK